MSIYIASVISSMLVGGVAGSISANGAISEFLVNGLLIGPMGATGPKGATGESTSGQQGATGPTGATGSTGATGATGTSTAGLTAGTYVATVTFASSDTGVITLGSSETTSLNFYQRIPGSPSSIININGSVLVGATFVGVGSATIDVTATIPNGEIGTQASSSCLVITTTAGGTSTVQLASLEQINDTTFRIRWLQISTGEGLIVTFNISFDPMITLSS